MNGKDDSGRRKCTGGGKKLDSLDKGWAGQLGMRHGTREVGGNQFKHKELQLRMFQAPTLIPGIPFQWESLQSWSMLRTVVLIPRGSKKPSEGFKTKLCHDQIFILKRQL